MGPPGFEPGSMAPKATSMTKLAHGPFSKFQVFKVFRVFVIVPVVSEANTKNEIVPTGKKLKIKKERGFRTLLSSF